MLRIILCFSGIMLVAASGYSQTTWYVPDDFPDGIQSAIDFMRIGVPGSSPVAYFLGTEIWDTPVNWWPYGLWYLKPPALGPYLLGMMPSPDGILTLSGNIPLSPPGPYTVYIHGLIGVTSTNLVTLNVQ